MSDEEGSAISDDDHTPDPEGVNMNPVEAEVFEFLKDHVEPPIDAHELQDRLMVGLPHLTIGQIRHSLGFLNNVGIIEWEPYEEGD